MGGQIFSLDLTLFYKSIFTYIYIYIYTTKDCKCKALLQQVLVLSRNTLYFCSSPEASLQGSAMIDSPLIGQPWHATRVLDRGTRPRSLQ